MRGGGAARCWQGPRVPSLNPRPSLPHPAPRSGPIPDQWGSLESWEVLRLRHNKLLGPLPAGTLRLGPGCRCGSLRPAGGPCLPACASHRTHPQPTNRHPPLHEAGLARQQGLEILLADHNTLSGVLPTYWDAPRLLRLDLQHNALSGERCECVPVVPACVRCPVPPAGLCGVWQLHASAGTAAGPHRARPPCPAGPLPASLGALPVLTVLQAGHNKLAGDGSLEAFAHNVSRAGRLEGCLLCWRGRRGCCAAVHGAMHVPPACLG